MSIIILLLFFSVNICFAQEIHRARPIAEESDGSPSGYYWKYIFPNASITDNLDGTVTFDYGAGIGGALTDGSVLFIDGGTISEDNDNLFYDTSNARLGIGTTTPSVELDVVGDVTFTGTLIGEKVMIRKAGEDDFWIFHDEYGYPGFYNDYGDFTLGVSGTEVTYINYYNGTNVTIGYTDNKQTATIHGILDTGDIEITGNLGTAMTGTVTTDGTVNIVGSGTNFADGEIAVGDAIKIESDKPGLVPWEVFTVAGITDDTHLELDSAYAGSNDSGLWIKKDADLFTVKTGDNASLLTVDKSGNLTTTGTVTGATIAGANTNWDAAHTHISETGASHSYIDQAVTIASSPTFADVNITDETTGYQIDGAKVLYNTGDYNLFVGTDVAGDVGSENLFIGDDAGLNNTTGTGVKGTRNVYIGAFSGLGSGGSNEGSDNVGVGRSSFYANTTGYRNVALGRSALWANSAGYTNVGIGYAVLYDNQGGIRNTAIGYQAGGNVTGSYNIFIGGYAGYYQVAVSNKLIIDNQLRDDAAEEITNAILYGVMADTVAAQDLRINADVGINKTPTVALDVTGDIKFSGTMNARGTDGFTGTGAYTNFTIVGGIITDAN